MTETVYTKDPDAKLDYQVNWSNWLGIDTISSSTWVIEDGITKVSDTNTTTTATVWLSGGTSGETYAITNRIQTAGGRIDDRTFYVDVENR